MLLNKPVLGTAAAAATGDFCAAGDSRLTDARTPTAHAAAHTTGADQLADATTGTHGLLSTTDKTKLDGIAAGAEVNVNADWNAGSGDAQILNKPTLGTAAAAATTDFATAAQGTDARTPTAHASTHSSGQSDAISYGNLAGLPTLGTAAAAATTDFCGASDSRLSDKRTPTDASVASVKAFAIAMAAALG